MARSKKKVPSKIFHQHCRHTQIDRISKLPDEILDQILSWLPTKEAAQTSIISKRWRNLWASLSCLNINETDFSSGDTTKLYAMFEKFGNMILSHREISHIHTINIKFSDPTFSDLVRTWISSSMKFRPQVVSIEVHLPDPNFFEFIYTSASIEEMSLKIHGITWSSLPKAINLPCIRRLSLVKTSFDGNSLTRLFSGCPVLEELSLDMCYGDFSPIFNQKLICLSLIDCGYLYRGPGIWSTLLSCALPKIVNLPCIRRVYLHQAYLNEESIGKFLAGCPLLEDLSLENCCGEYLTLFRKNIKKLSMESCILEIPKDGASWDIEAAVIETNLCGNTTKSTILIECSLHPYDNTCHHFLLKFICDSPAEISPNFYKDSGLITIFSGVQSLEFYAPDSKVDLKKKLRRIGTFYNMENLSVRLAKWCMDPHEFDVVAWFLQNSPKLKQLTIYSPKCRIESTKGDKPKNVVPNHEIHYYNSLSVELSLCKKLKEVEIKFCKHLLSIGKFKEALLEDMHGLGNVKVVLSEFK